MNSNPFQQGPQPGDAFINTKATTVDAGLRTHMQKVFNYMSLGLSLTGLVAYLTANSPLMGLLFGNSIIGIIVALAPIGFILFLNFRLTQMSGRQALLTFFTFSAVMGLSMAAIFVVYAGVDIARAFFITAGTFAATSLYGYTTKSDLTRMGGFFMMGLIGILLASVVNIFMHSTMLQFVISCLGVLVFVGLTAYDTQKIKYLYSQSWGGADNQKLAVVGALSLYLDFINLFRFILQLMGMGRRS